VQDASFHASVHFLERGLMSSYWLVSRLEASLHVVSWLIPLLDASMMHLNDALG